MSYREIQPFTCLVTTLAAVSAVLVVAAILVPDPALTIAVVLVPFLALVVALFHRLRIEVLDAGLELAFGTGPVRRTLAWQDVASVGRAKLPWAWGYGLRWIPGGQLWRTSSDPLVELRLRDGRRVVVGTRDPEALLGAIARVRGATSA